ncbi:MAG: metallophosphoesterase family protein [Pirellulaceae bacterium]
MTRTIAIGDIHGCSQALAALIDAVAPTASDTLVLLGDYVDRGPDSRGVLQMLLALEQQCSVVPLLGNHEVMMLSVRDGEMPSLFWQRFGGFETLQSYGGELAHVDASHWEFLSRCRQYLETDSHIFMHANYIADRDLDDQPEETLFWTHVSSVVPPPHRSGKIAIVGHTPQFSGEILDLGHLKCIDTCCFAGGWLTALDVHSGQVWQAQEKVESRE